MLLKQLVQIKALKEGQMKNAIMDTVEDFCRNTEIPDGYSYAQAVSLIVKSIMNTDTMAAELPSKELTEYVKDYFAREDYEDKVNESINEAKAPKVKYTFQKINYDKFERIGDSTDDYDESEIDGFRVLCAYDGKNCIAIYYAKAKFGSYCPEFKGDMMDFAEADTLCPLDEGLNEDWVSDHDRKIRKAQAAYKSNPSPETKEALSAAYTAKRKKEREENRKTEKNPPKFTLKSQYESVHFNEANDTDMEFPKLLGKAGDFSVELNEGEKVSLMQRNKEIVSMPLVIWKQLSRV